jgi:predicted MPP superfamily phosphohydrolase
MSIKQTTNFFLFVFFLLAFNPLGAEKLNVVFLTDTHIGENCNGVLDYEVCKPVRALTDAVNKICSLQRVDAVFVTGDLTSSAQQREFEKFNEIMSVLDKGNIPWFPLLGNHDSWPYKKLSDGSFKQTETPEGDQRFARIFKSRLETGYKHHAFVSNWPNSTCPNQDYKGVQSWFHNFQVTFPDVFPGLSFLALDWTSRKSALPEPGVGPEAELHDFDCGTTDWLSARLSESSDSDRFFLLQHHPFHNRDSLDPLGHNRYIIIISSI